MGPARRARKVGALIVGAQKGGTTALFRFLSEHPDIVTPLHEKELHYFDDDDLFVSGTGDEEFYHARFEPCGEKAVWLEATPIYMYWWPCAARMARYNPQLKLLFILRDPVDRAISQWEMEHSRGAEPECFEEAIRLEMACAASQPLRQHRTRSYLSRGFYGRQVRHMLEYFPRCQMLFLTSDGLRSKHEATLQRVCRFLRVPPFESLPSRQMVYPTTKLSQLRVPSARVRDALRSVFVEDLRLLHALTGLDVSAWMPLSATESHGVLPSEAAAG